MNRQLERLLTSAALLWERCTRARGHTGSPQNVLVLHFPVAVGIAMAETSMLEALKQLRPAPHITVAAGGSALEVLRHSPFVDKLIAVPHPAHNLYAAVRALRSQLGAVDYVLLGAFDRQRAIVRLGRLATRAWRGGFAEEPHTVGQPLAYNPALSVLRNHLRAAELLGWRGPLPPPKIYFTADHVSQARAWLGDSSRPALLVISQGNSGSAWVPERMAEVLRYAQAELGYRIVLDGGPGQEPEVEHLRTMVEGSLSLAGKTGLCQLAALAAASDLVLSVDTGPLHVAEATGVPMLQLSPQWVNVSDWHPLCSDRITLLHGERTGPVKEGYSMEELEVDTVKAALAAVARRFPPSAEARAGRLRAWCTKRDLLA